MFKKYDKCWSDGQNYCCPDPVSLSDCHWEAGSGGADCANANCGETEVEVDRATYGDKSKGCDCRSTTALPWLKGYAYSLAGLATGGRQKAMCCTVKKAPIKAATCSVDLCAKTPGYCPATDNDSSSSSSSSGKTKRDLALLSANGHATAHALNSNSTSLQPRGGDQSYWSRNGLQLISVAYPSLLAMLAFPPNLQALREWFRLDQGPCLGRNIETGFFSTHGNNPNMTGLEVEHPIDRQVMVAFLDTVTTGVLPSLETSQFTPIDRGTLRRVLHAENEALAQEPPVQIDPDGLPVGIQPDTPNDRLFEALGSNDYPYPFSLVERQINNAKGRLMGGKAPTAIKMIRNDSTNALKSGNEGHINKMLQDVRVVLPPLPAPVDPYPASPNTTSSAVSHANHCLTTGDLNLRLPEQARDKRAVQRRAASGAIAGGVHPTRRPRAPSARGTMGRVLRRLRADAAAGGAELATAGCF